MADHALAQHAHLQQDGVAIAIGRRRDHLQPVARGLTLGPKLVAGAAEKSDVAGPQGLLKRLAIHEAQHQNLAVGRILHDGGQQALHLVEVDLCLSSRSVHAFSNVLAETKSPLSRIRVSGLNLCEWSNLSQDTPANMLCT